MGVAVSSGASPVAHGELAALRLEVPRTPGPLLRHPPLHIAELSGLGAALFPFAT